MKPLRIAAQAGLWCSLSVLAVAGPTESPKPGPSATNTKSSFKGARVVLTHSITIHSTPEKIFPLLCPVREGEWAGDWDWDGRPVYSVSGVSEENAVFATRHAGEEDTIWYVIAYDKEKFINEMIYVMPEGQIVRLHMKVTATGKNLSRIDLRYIRTGLNEAGNKLMAHSKAHFLPMMAEWEKSLDHYLTTGKVLRDPH